MFSKICGHLFDLSIIDLFEMSKSISVVFANKIDSDTFSTPTARTTDTMNVSSFALRNIKVNNDTNLLNINTTSERSEVIRTRQPPSLNALKTESLSSSLILP